jgi:hypothetical protein
MNVWLRVLMAIVGILIVFATIDWSVNNIAADYIQTKFSILDKVKRFACCGLWLFGLTLIILSAIIPR